MEVVKLHGFRTILPAIVALLAASAPVWAQTLRTGGDDTILRQVVIYGRHSVRAPVAASADLARFSVKPYPEFAVPPGYLTEHGRQAEVLLGSYFRAYLLHEGLLTGNSGVDAARSYFRSNSIQRSNVTAAALGAGLFPGEEVPVHSYALGEPDPVFDPIAAKVAVVDPERAANEVQGVFNGDSALKSAYSGEFALIRSVLFGYAKGTQPPPAAPAGLVDATSQPIPLSANTSGLFTGNVINTGGLLSVMLASDPFLMQYAEGMPLEDVGWGQLTLDELSQQSRLVGLIFQLEISPPYLARVQSSNAASHVLRSMEQAVIHDTLPGSFGDARTRTNVIISSDAYVAGLAALLGLHWVLPGYQPDFCAPGGALVFELRQSRGSGEYLVRIFYTAQTLDQLRKLTPLTLDQPPATMQLAMPGARRSGAGLDIRFGNFQRFVREAMSQKYVQDPMEETPPGILTGVPLK